LKALVLQSKRLK